jgi:hypothetical protein
MGVPSGWVSCRGMEKTRPAVTEGPQVTLDIVSLVYLITMIRHHFFTVLPFSRSNANLHSISM